MSTPITAAVAAASLLVAGCAFPAVTPPAFSTVGSTDAVATVLDAGCARPDPRIEAIATRLAALSGREGYYAKREMAVAARDRDELVLRLAAREQAVARCAPEGADLVERRRDNARLMQALCDGRDPAEWQRDLVVFDLRLQPMWLPLGHRACDGHGFEGAAACMTFGPFAAIADIVTFPLGSWIWAGKDRSVPVRLSAFPPSPEAARAAAPVIALGKAASSR